jgi:Fic family protein
MDEDEFALDAPGQLIEVTVDDYSTPAFVPDDLPPTDLNHGDFINEVGQAMLALGQLGAIGPLAGSNTILVEGFARKEAVQSSRIEGTQVTLSDMYQYEAKQTSGTDIDTEGARQAKNYLKSLEHGLNVVQSGQAITVSLLCEMHEILLDGVRSGDPNPGEFRQSQNYLAPFEDADITRATFVPPPPEQICEKMENLLEFTNERQPVHPLLKIGLIHYQFETIHPFRDGNGRLGRLLISLELQREELLPKPYLYLSAFFNEYRPDYTRLLSSIRRHGSFDEWLQFFLRGIWTQAEEARVRGEKLLKLQKEYTDRYQDHRSPYILPLAHQLFENPYTTPQEVKATLDCSHQTAYNLINELQTDGVLVATGSNGDGQFYYAKEVYDILDEPITDF